jgi:hypothetical protein
MEKRMLGLLRTNISHVGLSHGFAALVYVNVYCRLAVLRDKKDELDMQIYVDSNHIRCVHS